MPTTFAEVPFFRIAVTFIAGIVFYQYVAEYDLSFYLTVAALVLILGFVFYKRFGSVLLPGVVILSLTFIAAFLRADGLSKTDNNLHFTKLDCNQYLLEGRIKEVNERESGMTIVIAVKNAICEGGRIRSEKYNRGKILITTRGKSRLTEWIPGTEVRLIAEVNKITPPANPKAFNYKAFMARKRIYHRAFVAEDELEIISTDKNLFQRGIFVFRRAFIENLKNHTHKENTAGILTGIVLGDKSLMDEDIHRAFRDVGAAHVLAVSGLHVGIVFSILFFGFKKLPDYATAILSLAGIWAFILLAGMPPSAIRAGTMFSLFSIGKLFKKRANPVNILSFCAIIHLFIEPQLAFDVGFQFSYLALLGIIIFFNKVNAIIPCPHPSLKIPRDLISLSVAAQLGVLPLSIYYFNQASPYFMLSSIFSVLGAYILLCGGLFVGLMGFIFSPLAKLAGYILDGSSELLSACMLLFTELPGATVSELYLSKPTVIIIYLLIILFALIIYKRIRNYQPLLMLGFVFFLFSGFSTKQQLMSSNAVYIYSTGRSLLVDVFSPGKAMTIYCKNLNEHSEQFAANANRIAYRKKHREQRRIKTDSLSNLHIIRGAAADIIICSHNAFPESLIKKQERPFHIVFTHFIQLEESHKSLLSERNILSISSAAGNNFSVRRSLEQLAKQEKINFYNTFHKYHSIKNF